MPRSYALLAVLWVAATLPAAGQSPVPADSGTFTVLHGADTVS